MKLSEKLAALDGEAEIAKPARPAGEQAAKPPVPPAPHRERPQASGPTDAPEQPAPRPKRPSASWEESKRRVRELVLADLGPRLTGPKQVGEAL
ncbi:MAG: hypothetical protein ACRD0S_03335, partial [Acidimicrobiales bacterium]